MVKGQEIETVCILITNIIKVEHHDRHITGSSLNVSSEHFIKVYKKIDEQATNKAAEETTKIAQTQNTATPTAASTDNASKSVRNIGDSDGGGGSCSSPSNPSK